MGLFGGGGGTTYTQVSLLTPEQQALQKQTISQAMQSNPMAFDYINRLLSGDQGTLDAFSAPYMRKFQEEIIPSISERYTAQFGEGSHSSSGFQNAVANAGAGLSENLASLHGQLGLSALQALPAYTAPSYNQAFENVAQQKSGGFGSILGSALGGLAGSFTGTLGTNLGTNLGSSLFR